MLWAACLPKNSIFLQLFFLLYEWHEPTQSTLPLSPHHPHHRGSKNQLEKEQPQMDALGNSGFGMANLVLPEENVTFRSEIPALEMGVWPLQ